MRLWLTSFSWGQALLRTECFRLVQNGSFSSFLNYENIITLTWFFFPLPLLETQGDFFLWLLFSEFLYLPMSLTSIKGSDLPSVLTSLRDPTRVASFSVCSDFYLLRWSGRPSLQALTWESDTRSPTQMFFKFQC